MTIGLFPAAWAVSLRSRALFSRFDPIDPAGETRRSRVMRDLCEGRGWRAGTRACLGIRHCLHLFSPPEIVLQALYTAIRGAGGSYVQVG